MGRLEGKVAIVTGSGRGIGKSIARLFIEEGAAVLINDLDEEAAQLTARELQAAGGKVSVVAGNPDGDVTNESSCLRIVEAAREDLGGLHILVNNAGTTLDRVIHKMDDRAWRFILDVNLKGTFLMTKAVYDYFKRQRYGKIVNMSSMAGLGSNIGQANYATSKSAVISFTKSVAIDLAPYNVCVNVLAPGIIDTRLTRAIPSEKWESVTQAIPMGLGRPEHVARVVLGLCSEDFDYVTGQLIVVSGGLII
ncbi:SDR family oxidoreductase [Candidatus Bathyarchaeota archaeon]|nr:SDR family oxidoreductase [Candidatus Bathyarchaeota archaeon]